jgi:betaine-aldehyde dehydrogenase
MSNAKHGLALNWIGGAWVGASDVRPSIDPATYAVIGEYADGGLKAAHKAVEAAKRAFRETAWALDHELRARVLGQIADAFERNRNALLDLLATENGKVKGEAAFEVDMAPSKLRYYAAAALLESGRALTPKPGSISLILRQPMGSPASSRRGIRPWC